MVPVDPQPSRTRHVPAHVAAHVVALGLGAYWLMQPPTADVHNPDLFDPEVGVTTANCSDGVW